MVLPAATLPGVLDEQRVAKLDQHFARDRVASVDAFTLEPGHALRPGGGHRRHAGAQRNDEGSGGP